MQFLIEVIAFIVVFVMLRQILVKTFPVKKIGMSLSNDSKKALYYYRRRYQFIFILCSMLLGVVSFLLIRFLFVRLHYIGGADFVWIIEDVALFLPSLLIAFLISNMISPAINDYFQKDGLGFFFEGYTEEQLGFSKKGLNKIEQVLGISLAIILLVAEFNVYVKLNDNKLSFNNFLSESKVVMLTDVEKIDDIGRKQSLITQKVDTLNLNKYSGDFNIIRRKLNQ